MSAASFKAMGERAQGSTLRRFESASLAPERVVDLRPDHPAVVDGHTIFPKSVVAARQSPKLLVSGHNNPKLGAEVMKGDRAGWPIFHLTLEERATCPRSCAVWAGCYGNSMPFARRHRADASLVAVLRLEVAAACKMYPGGFLVRLHTLGDFVSVEYVRLWAELLDQHRQLHVFGYTARRLDAPDADTREIASAIRDLTETAWDRFAIRTSHAEAGPQRSIVVMADPERPDVIVCPAQTVKTEACATCGLCWASGACGKTIAFLKHGMKRRAGASRRERPALRVVRSAAPVATARAAVQFASGFDREEFALAWHADVPVENMARVFGCLPAEIERRAAALGLSR